MGASTQLAYLKDGRPNNDTNGIPLDQGARLIKKQWADALETSTGTPFWARENFKKYGYAYNGGSLPIGFTIGVDRNEEWIGMNCSSCHTSEFTVGNQAIRVDGGGTLADFQSMLHDLVKAVRDTKDDQDKWEKFLSATGSDDDSLEAEVSSWLDFREALLKKNRIKNGTTFGNYISEYGPGRLDAVGHILNKVAFVLDNSDPNHWASDAPVSYPFIWNAHQHDRIQWNGIASKFLGVGPGGKETDLGSLGRNVGQTIGVFGKVRVDDAKFTKIGESSIDVDALVELEQTLSRLESPKWPGRNI